MTRAAGIDVGGTKFLGVVIDDDGAVLHTTRAPTPTGADAIVDQLAALADQLQPYDTLGVGIAGLVTRHGVLRAAPNLAGATELAVGPDLSRRLGHPVAVDNDATCATLAEWRAGAGRGMADMVMVTLGTGIGGGLILGGELQRGANGFAGEFGHMVVDRDGIACVCGQRGCWERYASGSALRRMAGGRRGEEVVDAARDHDPASVALIAEFAHWVAIGLCNLTNLVDPACLVIGGGLAASADVLLPPIREAFESLLYSPEHRPHPQLRFAELGEQAGAIGAAMLPTAHHH